MKKILLGLVGIIVLLGLTTVFIVDENGIIKFNYTNPDYKVRLEKSEILKAAREAKSKS